MINWQTQMEAAIAAYQAVSAHQAVWCLNCQDDLEAGAPAIALDATLNSLFPGYANRRWCSTGCLVEWIQDRAWDVASAHGHCVEVAR